MYNIYTDGSCYPNPNGCGGWAFVVLEGQQIIHQESGCEKNTTNNRMELMAILYALKWADKQCQIYSDSQYCVNAIDKWYKSWVSRGTEDEKANIDLISEAYDLYEEKKAKIYWVKGHNGTLGNEIADELSNDEMQCVFKEMNGYEITMEEVNESFKKLKAYADSKPDKHKFIKRPTNQTKYNPATKQKDTPNNKPLTITTDSTTTKYIIVNGIKYKKVR